MPTVQELLASVDAARDEIVRLHQDLVRIPTLNYGSRPDTGNETPACELIRDKLKAAGISFFNDLHDGPYGLTIYVADPDGNKIELYETGVKMA